MFSCSCACFCKRNQVPVYIHFRRATLLGLPLLWFTVLVNVLKEHQILRILSLSTPPPMKIPAAIRCAWLSAISGGTAHRSRYWQWQGGLQCPGGGNRLHLFGGGRRAWLYRGCHSCSTVHCPFTALPLYFALCQGQFGLFWS